MAWTTSVPELSAMALLKLVDARQPVELRGMAKKIGLRVDQVSSTGFDGALLRLANRPRGIVAIRKTMESSRKRFTIAHEIGHYLLHDDVSPSCGEDEVGAGREKADEIEREANEFAGKLLMPSAVMRRIVVRFGCSIDTWELVRDLFRVSLTAAAARCVEETPEYLRAALVVSKNGIVKYFVKSPAFSRYIEIDREIPSGSIAKELSRRGVRRKKGQVSAEVWIDIEPGFLLQEESMLLPGYDTVLTLLTP